MRSWWSWHFSLFCRFTEEFHFHLSKNQIYSPQILQLECSFDFKILFEREIEKNGDYLNAILAHFLIPWTLCFPLVCRLHLCPWLSSEVNYKYNFTYFSILTLNQRRVNGWFLSWRWIYRRDILTRGSFEWKTIFFNDKNTNEILIKWFHFLLTKIIIKPCLLCAYKELLWFAVRLVI